MFPLWLAAWLAFNSLRIFASSSRDTRAVRRVDRLVRQQRVHRLALTNRIRFTTSTFEAGEEDMATDTTKTPQQRDGGRHAFVQGVHGVRYQVKDVARAVAFYTTHLGFTLERQQLPAFANVSLGDAQILLSGPGASGSRPMPNGQPQEPGGWNRVVLRVNDLPAFIDALKKAGLHFRNEMETGPGGKQIQIEDPDGNPIELFEPAR
jgi:glyoxylase I family protein